MECTITWNNVEGLMNIGNKLCVPSLQRICLNFLLTHAAGRPIKAMRIAELFEEEELYREASRFVLDNPGGWPEQELNTLSSETLLKLEKRRTWFLERVLKLGLVQIAKEYECVRSPSLVKRRGPLRTTTRRKMAASLPSRLPLRALPTLDGIPVPPHARRRQPTSGALAPHVPNDGQSLHSHTVRSDVLPWRARKRNGHRTPWCARRGRRGYGERDAPQAAFLVLLA